MSPVVVGMVMRHVGLPTLDTLGRDLLVVNTWRRAASLATPFLLTMAFFVFIANGAWIAALMCTMLRTFLTYGSISHDLVHRTRRLDPYFEKAGVRPLRLFF